MSVNVSGEKRTILMEKLGAVQAYLSALPQDAERERLLSGENDKDVYISRPCAFLLNRISAATKRLQTFPPVDATDAVDAMTQPLTEEGVTFFALHGHTDNDLCFRLDDKLFVGDVCMNGLAASGYSPIWIEDNDKLVESWRELIRSDAEYLYPGHGKPFPRSELEKYVEKQAKRKLCKLFK